MFAVIGIVLCCAVIPLAVGAMALLGRSKKDKLPANQEAAITQEERNR